MSDSGGKFDSGAVSGAIQGAMAGGDRVSFPVKQTLLK